MQKKTFTKKAPVKPVLPTKGHKIDSHDSLDDPSDSLDNSEVKNADVLFYFASGEKPKLSFQLTEKQARLSGTFSDMLDNEHAEKTTQSNPIVLGIISHPDESYFGKDVVYNINTATLLKYVVDYINLWTDDLDSSDYCTEEPVQSGDPTHYLKERDITYIENFISQWKYLTHEFDDSRYNSDPNYNRLVKIRTLSQLISQADNFLHIESIAKKLYIYIATIVWNTSIVDISEVESDPEFAKLQQDAITSWKLQNPEQSLHYAPSVTTGDGNENEDIIADLIGADID